MGPRRDGFPGIFPVWVGKLEVRVFLHRLQVLKMADSRILGETMVSSFVKPFRSVSRLGFFGMFLKPSSLALDRWFWPPPMNRTRVFFGPKFDVFVFFGFSCCKLVDSAFLPVAVDMHHRKLHFVPSWWRAFGSPTMWNHQELL